MSLAYFSHRDCENHEIAPGHPEQPARVRVIDQAIRADAELQARLQHREAVEVTRAQLLRAHSPGYLDQLQELAPTGDEQVRLDADTAMNAHSLRAASLAAGAACQAVDTVLGGAAQHAFCNVRPPGHHAEHDRAMGFCLYSSIAVAALHALDQHGLQRVAVADFDVHFGNGSSDILRSHPNILLLSSCQFPLYPLSQVPEPGPSERNITLPEGSDGATARARMADTWLPALARFKPQLLLISAGFDAHSADPLAGLNWQSDDYYQITRDLCAQAACPVVSSLEGGYDLEALAESARAHLRALCELPLDPASPGLQ